LEPKERILEGARELFFKHGTKTITMDDIAKHLGMSKKTLYQYFSNKNEVVESMMLKQLHEHECECQRMSDDSENVIEEVFAIMQNMGAFFSQANPNLFYDLQKYHSSSWNIFKKFKDEYMVKMVEESINKGIKQGVVRGDINSKIFARLRIKEVEMGFDPTTFPPEKFKIVDVQLALMDHFLHGICTLKGHKMINKHKAIIEEE
jgi:AcrR family transcriptional regulator